MSRLAIPSRWLRPERRGSRKTHAAHHREALTMINRRVKWPLMLIAATLWGPLLSAPAVGGGAVTVDPPRLRPVRAIPAAGSGTATALPRSGGRPVDPRLFRKITLRLKGVSLAAFCAELQTQTGVELRASQGVADEKVTILVREQPARDLMRAVARLFGYFWARSGEPGEYRYELEQDLKSRLVEEELRNRDLHEALLAMDQQMQKYRPYTQLSFEQLQKLSRQDGETGRLVADLLQYGRWAGLQLYHRLTPEERTALAAGQELVYRFDAPDSDRRLPEAWRRPIMQSLGGEVPIDDKDLPHAAVPEARSIQVRLKLTRPELRELTLIVRTFVVSGVGTKDPASPTDESENASVIDARLATGHSAALTNLDNAKANGALRGQSPFDQLVSLKPVASCPFYLRGRSGKKAGPTRGASESDGPPPHIFSADVWEAVHQATGLPIVADSYSRIWQAPMVTHSQKPLFELLCSVGDTLGARWTKDDRFLLCRTTSYLWDRLTEVPNRLLQRWSRDREANGGLPFADFLEMARLSDQQLDTATEPPPIRHCWGLREWGLLGSPSPGTTLDRNRLRARFLTTLTPEQLRRAMEPAGLPFKELPLAQQQSAMQLQYAILKAIELDGAKAPTVLPEDFTNAQIFAEYIPAGWYCWAPPWFPPDKPSPVPLGPVGGRTAAEALAAARRLYPQASPDQVRPPVGNGHFTAGIRFVGRPWTVIG
jgi:hypothetical protein